MKYWAYVNNEILGPYEKEKLFELPVFSPSTLICPQTPVGEKTEDWKEASTYPEIAAMLGSGAGMAPKKAAAPAPEPGPKLQLEPVVAPKPSLERATPVFNSDEPKIKLKSLSPSKIEQAPPLNAPGGINIGVKSLGHPGEQPQEPARVSGANFDPLTLTQIGRRADQASEPKAKAPEPEMFKPAESPAPSLPAEPAPAPAPVPAPAPAPIPAPVPEASSSYAPRPAVDMRAFTEISSKIETLAGNSVTRQDLAAQLAPLQDKLAQMGEVLSAIKNSQFQREIMDKLQYLENAVSDMKASIAQAPAAVAPASFKPADAAPAMAPVFGVQPPAILPPTPIPSAPADKPEIVDQGSSAKTSRIGGVLKKIFKGLLTIILLAAVLGVTAYMLKKLQVFDVTKFVPLPFMGAPNEAAPEPQVTSTQQLETPQGAAPAEPQQPPKPPSPEEINYFAQNYTAEKDGKTLQNSIFEDAEKRKGNFIKAAWTAKELPGGLFEASVTIPMTKGKGQLVYSYEIDYANKTLKARDEASKKPFDALSAPLPPAKPEPAKGKKGAKGAAKPAPKQAPKQVKAAEPADEEYEYEEVEEEEDPGTVEE